MYIWLNKPWEKTQATIAIEDTPHVSLWNNVGVRDSYMPSDGFEPKSHTVLRLGAAMIVVVATTTDISFAGATKKVAKGLVQPPVISSTLAWEASTGFHGWMSPWPAICSVLITPVWDADRDHYSETESIIWNKVDSSQLYKQAP